MRNRLEQTASAGDLKRGPGGIVDIEFLVQMLQLKHGRGNEELRGSNPIEAIGALHHAEIFSANLDHSSYYRESCFECHAVGFDKGAANNGFDDQADYGDFLNAGLLANPGDNWATMMASYGDSAQMANIQCENCHGPNDSDAHGNLGIDRINWSSDVCASCHGEPARHGRFQQ